MHGDGLLEIPEDWKGEDVHEQKHWRACRSVCFGPETYNRNDLTNGVTLEDDTLCPIL
jgi:hypothetical protein